VSALCFRRYSRALFLSCVFLAWATASVHAQKNSVALSVYGAFNGTTSANGVAQSPANQAGGIIELRHIKNPLVGYEATYSFNRANLGYSILTSTCTVSLTTCTTKLVKLGISSDAHEVTGDWVVSAHLTGYRVFALGGGGVLIDQPTSSNGTRTVSRFVYVYGGGIERSVMPRSVSWQSLPCAGSLDGLHLIQGVSPHGRADGGSELSLLRRESGPPSAPQRERVIPFE